MVTLTTPPKAASTSENPAAKPLAAMRAERYTSEAWFPVNPLVLRNIRKKMKENFYSSAAELLKDIEQDLSLFTYCLRQLCQSSRTQDSKNSIFMRLKALSLRDLQALVPVSESRVSSHKFANTNEIQARQWKQLVIGSTTAQALADKGALDPSQVCLGSGLRQLGLILVAWNYPRIYENVLRYQFSDEGKLETALAGILGFTPSVLAADIVKKWGLDQSFLELMLSKQSSFLAHPQASTDSQALQKYCELGEMLAQINDSEHFPGAKTHLEHVNSEIISCLGPSGLQILEQRINHSWKVVGSAIPERFNQPFSYNRHNRVALSKHSNTLFNRNQFIQQCPPELQEQFVNVYANMIEGRVSPTSLKILLSDLVPNAGFEIGCIYMADPKRMVMVPKMMIGDAPPEEFTPIFQTSRGLLTDPLSLAQLSNTPIKGQVTTFAGDEVAYLAGSIGRGVLYLESRQFSLKNENEVPIVRFKAIRECLCEALGIVRPSIAMVIDNSLEGGADASDVGKREPN